MSEETNKKLRIIVVFRSDLPEMTPAKAEVQFGHAVFECASQAYETDPELARQYRNENQVKLSMEVDSLEDLMKIKAMADKRGVIHSLITDAGHTCFDGPTMTCIGLGPMSKTDGNALTRNARMRK